VKHSPQGVPGPKPIPVLGNLLDMAADPLRFFAECAATHGPVVKLRLARNRETYLLSRPEHIEFVLGQTQRLFAKGYHHDRILSMVLGNGLVTSEGDFWLRQRRLSQPAFHQHRIEQYAAIMSGYAERMIEPWQDGERRNLHADLMQCTMEIAATTLFDVDLRADYAESGRIGEAMDLLLSEYAKQFTSAARHLLQMLRLPLPSPGDAALKRSVATLDRIIYDIIEDRLKENRDRGDLLSMLLEARDDDGAGMSKEQLRDEVMTLFLAGHETTANALSWTLYLLAKHPEAEAALVAELDRVLDGRPPAFADLPRLEYTNAVVKESMRLYPPVWYISREPLEDVTIGGYTLPAGSEMALSQWVMHRHPDYFEEPDAFRPERWTSAFEKSLPPYVYFPFGAGPRVCIGKSFATMESALLLAAIVRKFRIRLDADHDVRLEASVTLRPKTGIYAFVTKR